MPLPPTKQKKIAPFGAIFFIYSLASANQTSSLQT